MKKLMKGPRWVTVDDELRLLLRPVATDVLVAAMAPVLELQRIHGDENALARLKAGGASAEEIVQAVAASQDMVLRLLELQVADWTVCDEAGDKLEPSPEAFEALLISEPEILGKLMTVLVGPLARQVQATSAEKNA